MVVVRDIDQFEGDTISFDQMLKRYAVSGWGRRGMKEDVFRNIMDRGGGRLLSASAPARIAVARATVATLDGTLAVSRRKQAFFVTFTPTMGVMQLGEALKEPSGVVGKRVRSGQTSVQDCIRRLQEWARRQLANTAFLGIVEVAFYSRHPTWRTDGPVVCLHVHALAWNTSRAEMDDLQGRLNATHSSFIPGIPPAHISSLNTRQRVVGAVLYALKPPVREYVAYESDGGRGRSWEQRKRPMRPGDASKVARVFVGVELDDLLFDGGQAIGFTREIASNARQAVRRDEQRALARLRKIRGR